MIRSVRVGGAYVFSAHGEEVWMGLPSGQTTLCFTARQAVDVGCALQEQAARIEADARELSAARACAAAGIEATIHALKIPPPYFDAVQSGRKTFEVRRDDRGFQRGDWLVLREWAPKNPDSVLFADRQPSYTGREITRRITFILTGGQFGIEPGFVVMALAEPEVTS